MCNAITITPETTVSTIAASHPATLRMMEALGIDYCCGGKLPLADAATRVGLPVETVIAVLQTAIAQAGETGGADRNWQDALPEALLAHIVSTHHAYLHRELPRLEVMLETVARVHGPHHGDVLAPLLEHFRALKTELTAHLAKEEETTFPAIEQLLQGESGDTAVRTIAELADEHEAAGALLEAMRTDTRNYTVPEDACNTFRALYDGLQELEGDIHRHIHLENNILFPRVLAVVHRNECPRQERRSA